MLRNTVAHWSLILLLFSMAAAIGGGIYESMIINPMWRKSPPLSFAIIQPETGMPLQRFWIPVHVAITLFIVVALAAAWRDVPVRQMLLIGLASYVLMRVWSGFYFIPEMLSFQKVPLDVAPSAELIRRVSRWTFLTIFREPLDVISFVAWLLAFGRFKA